VRRQTRAVERMEAIVSEPATLRKESGDSLGAERGEGGEKGVSDVQLDADFLSQGFAAEAVLDEGLEHVASGRDIWLEAFLDEFVGVAGKVGVQSPFVHLRFGKESETYPIMAPNPHSSPSLGMSK
jgi:hypothetical protein